MADIKVVPIAGGANPAIRYLGIVSRRLKKTRRANRQVSIWLMRWVNDNFKTEGGKVKGWRPFKFGGRRLPGGAIDTSAKLLQDTGRLRLSIQPFFNKSVAGVGSDLRYSITHELGFPHRNLPARRMLPLSSDRDVVSGVTRIYNVWLRKAIK